MTLHNRAPGKKSSIQMIPSIGWPFPAGGKYGQNARQEVESSQSEEDLPCESISSHQSGSLDARHCSQSKHSRFSIHHEQLPLWQPSPIDGKTKFGHFGPSLFQKGPRTQTSLPHVAIMVGFLSASWWRKPHVLCSMFMERLIMYGVRYCRGEPQI